MRLSEELRYLVEEARFCKERDRLEADYRRGPKGPDRKSYEDWLSAKHAVQHRELQSKQEHRLKSVPMHQPWRCETCGASSMAQHQSDLDASQILFQARREHWKADGCKGRLIFGER